MKKSLPKHKGREKIIFKGKLIEVVHQEMEVDGKEFTIEFARRTPGTRLIIVSPDNKILLTEEYRTDLQDWDIKLPGGKVVDSLKEHEKILQTKEGILEKAIAGAKKEALEEAGIDVEEIKLYTISHCGVTMIWDLYYFIVTKYREHPDGQKLELGENIKLKWVSFEQAKSMCLDGSIREDRSATILLRFLNKNAN